MPFLNGAAPVSAIKFNILFIFISQSPHWSSVQSIISQISSAPIISYLHVRSWLLTPPPHDLEHSVHGPQADQKARLWEFVFFLDEDDDFATGPFVVVVVVITFGGWAALVVAVSSSITGSGRRFRSFQRLDGGFLNTCLTFVGGAVILGVVEVTSISLASNSVVPLVVVVELHSCASSVVEIWKSVDWLDARSVDRLVAGLPMELSINFGSSLLLVNVVVGEIVVESPFPSLSSDDVIRSYL